MPAIDQAIFTELKEMSGEDFINELIDAFLEEGPSLLANLEAALAARDLEAFRRNAHSLKSNANTFGARTLAAQAKELEFMAREGSLEVGDRLAALQAAFQTVAVELKELRV